MIFMKKFKKLLSVFLALVLCMALLPVTASAATTLSTGSKGTQVKYLQLNLNGLGYGTLDTDGQYGSKTKASVIKFQKAYGLTTDGMAGPQTLGKIDGVVKGIQGNLNKLGYSAGSADGVYGNNTKNAVKKFQKAVGLTTDGIAGANTLKALNAKIEELNKKATTNTSSSSSTSSVPPVDIFVKQGNRNCTAASATMLLRANQVVNGNTYSNITLDKVMKVAWNSGLINNFTYNGVKVTSAKLTGSASEKKAKVEKLLKQHPEGIVLYGWDSNHEHAIYMAANGKILDPALSKKYINMSESARSVSANWGTINKYWIIKK